MAKSTNRSKANVETKEVRSTIVELARRSDGMWEATQQGLEIVGIGDSAARATEDMARQIADRKEQNDI